MVQRYLSPEGFELDTNSGMYYRYDYVDEENGQQTCWLTWFNAETGEYTQQNCPELTEITEIQEIAEPAEITEITQIAEIAEIQEIAQSAETETLKSSEEEEQEFTNEIGSTESFDIDDVENLEIENVETLELSNTEEEHLGEESLVLYLPPENYQYHYESGLYYDLYTYVNEDGSLIDFVTWFDADSGEYAQVEYLLTEEPLKPQTIESFKPEIATSFVPFSEATAMPDTAIPNSETAYVENFRTAEMKSETMREEQLPFETKKAEGKKQKIILLLAAALLVAVIGITWHMGMLDKIPIPFLNQGEEKENQEAFSTEANCSVQVQIVSPREAVIQLEIPNLKSEYEAYDKSFDDGHMIYNWEVLFGDYSIALNHINKKENKGKKISPEDMQSSLWEYEDENNFSTLIPFVENTIENQVITWEVKVPDRNFSFYEVEEYKLNLLDEEGYRSTVLSAEEVLKEEKVTISQLEFAHNNMYELMSDEDEDYMYTIYLSDPYWKFSMEGIGGPIYRIKKGEKNVDAEKMIDFGEGFNTASSIAVLGDYIYFSSYTYRNIGDSDQYAYFRIPKKGGKAEKIFEEEFSYIRAYEGKLYFLFPSKESYGVYDPNRESLDLVSIHVMDMVDIMQGGARSEAYLFRPFSVYQGDIYVGCSFDYSGYYSKISLSDGAVKTFLKTSLDGISGNDEGGVFIYGVNPFYLNQGVAIINTDINAFLCRTSENLIAVDKSSNGEGLVFKQIHEDNATFDNTKLFEVALSEQSKPYAGIGNWIFLTDKAICIESNQVTKTVWFGEAKDITNKWDLTQMKESLY